MDTDSAVFAKKELQGITFLFAFYVILTSSFSANPENVPSASQVLYEKLALVDSSVFAILYPSNPTQHSIFFANNYEFSQHISGVFSARKELLETLENSSCEEQKEFTIKSEIAKTSNKMFPSTNGKRNTERYKQKNSSCINPLAVKKHHVLKQQRGGTNSNVTANQKNKNEQFVTYDDNF